MTGKMRSLSQTLAIESQVRLPGTVGRLLKQIRDIEGVAPEFKRAGLIKTVNRPQMLDLQVAGIASRSVVVKALGGFLYGAASVSTELSIEKNIVATRGNDSVSELDDIDFESQRKRLDLVEMRQAYQLAEKVLTRDRPLDLILFDTPLFISRDMVPVQKARRHVEEFEKTRNIISTFWDAHRTMLFPWNSKGPVLGSILAERFSAIVSIAKRDIRTSDGRQHLLSTDGVDPKKAKDLSQISERVMGIGDFRFINGILSSFTRTAAFRLTAYASRMEPKDSVGPGVIGFHFKGGMGENIHMVQLAGDEPLWDLECIDRVCGQLMNLCVIRGKPSVPLPLQLAVQELKAIDQFVKFYRSGINNALKDSQIEDTWLSGLDEEWQ